MNRDKLLGYLTSVLPMPRERADQIAAYFNPIAMRRNDLLLKAGHISHIAYFLEEGYCRAFTYDVDNNDVTTALHTSGDFASELISFFRQTPSQETIQALTDCRGWAISYNDVQVCFHSIPEFRELGSILLINSYDQLKQRILAMIQKTAEQRYAQLMAASPDIFQHVPLAYIATYLGVKETYLSRIRKEFARREE